MKRDSIVSFLNEYLAINAMDDYSYNGLQYEGSEDVKKIGFAVDSGIQVFEKAVEENIDLLVVHHGLFWKKQNPTITGVHKKRLKTLFQNDISLYAAHLPLDYHKEIGNNVGIAQLLNADVTDGFSSYQGFKIGAIAELSTGLNIEEISTTIEKKLCCETKLVKTSNSPINKIAVMSGAGSREDLHEVAELGVDLLITGEQTELYHDAFDYGVSVIFAGHHATETVGVSLLMKKVGDQFPELETFFIDCPTSL